MPTVFQPSIRTDFLVTPGADITSRGATPYRSRICDISSQLQRCPMSDYITLSNPHPNCPKLVTCWRCRASRRTSSAGSYLCASFFTKPSICGQPLHACRPNLSKRMPHHLDLQQAGNETPWCSPAQPHVRRNKASTAVSCFDAAPHLSLSSHTYSSAWEYFCEVAPLPLMQHWRHSPTSSAAVLQSGLSYVFADILKWATFLALVRYDGSVGEFTCAWRQAHRRPSHSWPACHSRSTQGP
jgi:hypothetical protein